MKQTKKVSKAVKTKPPLTNKQKLSKLINSNAYNNFFDRELFRYDHNTYGDDMFLRKFRRDFCMKIHSKVVRPIYRGSKKLLGRNLSIIKTESLIQQRVNMSFIVNIDYYIRDKSELDRNEIEKYNFTSLG